MTHEPGYPVPAADPDPLMVRCPRPDCAAVPGASCRRKLAYHPRHSLGVTVEPVRLHRERVALAAEQPVEFDWAPEIDFGAFPGELAAELAALRVELDDEVTEARTRAAADAARQQYRAAADAAIARANRSPTDVEHQHEQVAQRWPQSDPARHPDDARRQHGYCECSKIIDGSVSSTIHLRDPFRDPAVSFWTVRAGGPITVSQRPVRPISRSAPMRRPRPPARRRPRAKRPTAFNLLVSLVLLYVALMVFLP